jgi:hypothetical protein
VFDPVLIEMLDCIVNGVPFPEQGACIVAHSSFAIEPVQENANFATNNSCVKHRVALFGD